MEPTRNLGSNKMLYVVALEDGTSFLISTDDVILLIG